MHQQRKDPLEGATVDGRYVVHSKLARGGMSTVYVATDRRLDRRVALKVLFPYLAEEPGFIDRFEQEAKSAARLSHPHVVGVLDQGVDEAEGRPIAYLVMEFVSGRTLRDVLRERGRLTPRDALGLLDAVVEGLAAAHEAGLIHRDVKPENVLISDTDQVKIADFGLARAVSASTGTATLVGTVAYLSPELVLGRPAEAQSDIYSIGVMLFELLTGRQPFTGETPIQVAIQHARSEVPVPSDLLPGLAPDIDELVQWCTSRDPEDRPVDGTALLGELRHIRRTLTDDELDFAPLEAPGPASRQDQLTISTIPRPGADGGRTEALPPSGFGSIPRRADDGSVDPTDVLSPLPAEHNRTRVVPRDRNATRVIGAIPLIPPSSTAHPEPVHGADSTDAGRSAGGSSAARPPSRRQQARRSQRPEKSLHGRTARRWVRLLVVLLVLLAGLVAGAGWLLGAGPAGPVLSEERAVAALEGAKFDAQLDYTFGSAVLGLVAGRSPTGEQPEGTTIRFTVT